MEAEFASTNAPDVSHYMPPNNVVSSESHQSHHKVVSSGTVVEWFRLQGPGFKPRPGQKFENENYCFRRTPTVMKACNPCRVRPIKTPLCKTCALRILMTSLFNI